MDGKWERRGNTNVYDNEWLKADIASIALPDGSEIEHHVVTPKYTQAVGMLCHDPDKGVLMLWRHRFIVDEWGWELPAGGVEKGEIPEHAAKRETLEETGWQPKGATSFVKYQPMGGLVQSVFETFYSEGADWVGPGRDVNEANDLAWLTLDQLRTFIRKGEVNEGLSLTSLLFAFQFGPLSDR